MLLTHVQTWPKGTISVLKNKITKYYRWSSLNRSSHSQKHAIFFIPMKIVEMKSFLMVKMNCSVYFVEFFKKMMNNSFCSHEQLILFSWTTHSVLMNNSFCSFHEELILLFSFRWTSGWVTGSSLKFVNEKLFCYVTLSCLRL